MRIDYVGNQFIKKLCSNYGKYIVKYNSVFYKIKSWKIMKLIDI